MEQASLVGLDTEGTALILTVPGGKKLRLPIDDALKAAIRSDRSGFERARAQESSLRPRDIQARVRAGASAEDLSAEFGVEYDFIMRYAAPVLDERAYFAEQAAALPVTHDFDAPAISELVPERLAEVQVPESEITFDAWRDEDGWLLMARFGEGTASWRIDLPSKNAEPADELARRIVTGEPVGPLLGRHLAAVQDEGGEAGPRALHPSIAGHPSMAGQLPPPDPASLLSELDEARGVRVDMHLADDPFAPDDEAPERDEDAEVFSLSARSPHPVLGPASGEDGPTIQFPADESAAGQFDPASGTLAPARGASSPSSAARGGTPGPAAPGAEDEARDLPTVPLPADDGDEATRPDDSGPRPPKPAKPGSRSKRASVPSWDEIVFGAKPE